MSRRKSDWVISRDDEGIRIDGNSTGAPLTERDCILIAASLLDWVRHKEYERERRRVARKS